MKSIFYYSDLSRFLKDTYLAKRSANVQFSMRSWAKKMGMSSHGALQQAMKGQRVLPEKYLPHLCQELELNEEEAQYLELLLKLGRAKTQEEQLFLRKRILKMSKNIDAVTKNYIDNYRFFSNPLYSILRSLIRRSDFLLEVNWIKERLSFSTDHYEIKSALDDLVDMELIVIEDGKAQNLQGPLTNKEDIPSDSVRTYHQKMSLMASKLIEKQSVNEREFNSFSINIDPKDLPEIKASMRSYLEKLMHQYEKHDHAETYHINLQFFKLADKEKTI